jgi:cobalt transporter subunit CbtB
MHSTASPAIVATARLSRAPAFAALVLGLLIVFGAGFASPATIHNATHDTRHAFGLPCH